MEDTLKIYTEIESILLEGASYDCCNDAVCYAILVSAVTGKTVIQFSDNENSAEIEFDNMMDAINLFISFTTLGTASLRITPIQ